MTSVLITAFKPYDGWKTNASWLTLVELTKNLPREVDVTTRLYPVDYPEVKRLLSADIAENYDYSLHLGQSPGAVEIQLESFGLNIATEANGNTEDHRFEKGDCEQFRPLVQDGPAAYQSRLPLAEWAQQLRDAGFPARVSHHAGTFLCNATFYLARHYAQKNKLPTRSAFVHVPLDPTQAAQSDASIASLPATFSAAAIRLLLDQMANRSVQ